MDYPPRVIPSSTLPGIDAAMLHALVLWRGILKALVWLPLVEAGEDGRRMLADPQPSSGGL